MAGEIRPTFLILVMVTIFRFCLTSPTTTTLQPSQPTIMSIQKSLSFEARTGKSWREPIIMELLPNDSYFPKSTPPRTKGEISTTPLPTSLQPKPNESSSKSNDVNDPEASSLSYSSAWSPMSQNSLPAGAYGQPVYFPSPAMYGYSVNNYEPPLVNFGGGPPNQALSYGAPLVSLKQEEPSQGLFSPTPNSALRSTTQSHIPDSDVFSVPVKSVEYAAPVKTEYVSSPVSEKPIERSTSYGTPTNEISTPSYGIPTSTTYGIPGKKATGYSNLQSNHGIPTSLATSYGIPNVPSTYGAPTVATGYGKPLSVNEKHLDSSSTYGNPAVSSLYEKPGYDAPGPVYGAPTNAVRNPQTNNHHQKILHRYHHHQNVLHENNLYRYIVHNVHLHRFHIHNYHNEKEHIHQHQTHTHEKFEKKETEEHKTKETVGETHKDVTEVKETQRHAPPIYQMHVVKPPHWSNWG